MAQSAHDPREFIVDVVSDVVCPWCYIGKRRLAAALEMLAGRNAQPRPVLVRWHGFQLNAHLPPEGMDRRAYVEAKFGGAARAAQVYDRIAAIGATVGIAFAFERIKRVPNTTDAHRLIAWAQRRMPADALVEALFHAFFCEGRDVGDRDELSAIAGEAGLDTHAAGAYLASEEGAAEIAAADRRARELSIEGVPFFVFAGRIAVSGAQEPATLLEAMGQAGAPID